jgi:DNA-binding IclR family transcriptional regulator
VRQPPNRVAAGKPTPLDAIRGSAHRLSTSQIANLTGIGRVEVRAQLVALQSQGLIVNTGDDVLGMWSAAPQKVSAG